MTRDKQIKTPAIDRRGFLKTSGAAACGLAVGPAAAPAITTNGGRPNILLLLTDQQHIDTIAAAGCPHLQTPAMDELAASGTNFRLSHTANPVCSPARASIFTGRTPSETGVYTNGKPIRATIPNLGQWLGQRGGYDTVYAGKWHLPGSYATSIPGFDVLHTGIGGQGNVCDSAVGLACEGYLRNRRGGDPFLMVASFMQPHDICEWLRLNRDVPQALRYPDLADELPPLPENFQFDAREPERVKTTREKNEPSQGGWTPEHWRYYLWSYYRHVEMVDGEIGRVAGALRDTRQTENTLILLTADHGEGLARHQMVRKSSPYDEAMKVPMIVVPPGGLTKGRTDNSHLASGLDVMPTLCDYAGLDAPEKMRGRSLRAATEGDPVEGDHYLVTEINNDSGRIVRTQRYKYVSYRGDPVDQLFDMHTDPGETRNLADETQYALTVAEHRELLRRWEARLEVAPNVPPGDAWWRVARR
jgi:choline-sulfatase